MMENQIDTVVLGCTHYPFVIPLIKEIVGPEITVIDPSPAVANQTFKKMDVPNSLNHSETIGESIMITSGTTRNFKEFIDQINLESENLFFYNAKWSVDKTQINMVQE
jgi:glutamate racemase